MVETESGIYATSQWVPIINGAHQSFHPELLEEAMLQLKFAMDFRVQSCEISVSTGWGNQVLQYIRDISPAFC